MKYKKYKIIREEVNKMTEIFNWLDRVLSVDYMPTDKDCEILYYLRLVQILIKEYDYENKK